MQRSRFWSGILLAVFFLCVWPPPSSRAADEAVDFSRDIRPLLSDRCFACHGPEEATRQGGFRLDRKDSVLGEADSGERPVVAGDPEASELYRRVTSEDEWMRMPPEDSGKSLTAEEIERLRRWIAEGARWQEHWSLIAPQRPQLPPVRNASWPRNEIDHFILARLEREGLEPQAEADKATLIRRLSFDLTGLPPEPAEVDAFLADGAADAYERLVERLLESPRYGEHMARFWLDAARYGDTHGLHLDNYREMWPYRDWVIEAFQQNMPYDRFTIEQLAGDLLPDATQDQLVATGFNRCHVTTNEGGAIAEEWQVRNVVDRVVTTGTVFMALSFDCTRCHDHKYDPLTMKDFYSMFAFFNSLDGSPLDGNVKDHAPVVKVLSRQQETEIAQLRAKIESLQADVAREVAAYAYAEPAEQQPPRRSEPEEIVWIEDDLPAGAKAEGGWEFVDSPVYSGSKASKRSAAGLSQHFFTGASPLGISEGDRLFAYVYLDPDNPPQEIMLQWNDGSWEHRAFWGGDHITWGQPNTPSRRAIGALPEPGKWVRLEIEAAHVGLGPGAALNGWAFTQFDGTVYWDKAGIVSQADAQPAYDSLAAWLSDQHAAGGAKLPDPLKTLAKSDPSRLDEDQHRQLRDHYVEHIHEPARSIFRPLHAQIDQTRKKLDSIEASAATTLVFRERKDPLPAHILHRGEYDQQRERVERATPPFLPPLPDGAPLDRLGLAQWIVHPSHPLTARVAVNRFWQQVFGTGIVKTAEDFGSQGDAPSHPQLLDWLAVEFRESGWEVQTTMKRIVMSATYRQAARATPELLRRDPANRLLARGPRFRLDAEMLRDQALAVSGLLVEQRGGPSVKPPQPDLWFAVGYSGSNTVRFEQDRGPDKVHRRSLYTFLKRTSPPPQMSTFDAPSRESCIVRRERTNTPLQALLLMNDPQYFEAARALGQRALLHGGSTPESRAAYAFRLCIARPPATQELAELVQLFEANLQRFRQDTAAAASLIAVGESAPDASLDPAELAAWAVVANLLLNLDEVLTKN